MIVGETVNQYHGPLNADVSIMESKTNGDLFLVNWLEYPITIIYITLLFSEDATRSHEIGKYSDKKLSDLKKYNGTVRLSNN